MIAHQKPICFSLTGANSHAQVKVIFRSPRLWCCFKLGMNYLTVTADCSSKYQKDISAPRWMQDFSARDCIYLFFKQPTVGCDSHCSRKMSRLGRFRYSSLELLRPWLWPPPFDTLKFNGIKCKCRLGRRRIWNTQFTVCQGTGGDGGGGVKGLSRDKWRLTAADNQQGRCPWCHCRHALISCCITSVVCNSVQRLNFLGIINSEEADLKKNKSILSN